MGTGSELSTCSRWGYPGCVGGVSDDDEWQAGSRQRRDEFRRVQGLWSLRGGLPAQGAEPGRRIESLWLPPGYLPGQRLHRLRDLLLRLPGTRRNSGAAPGIGTTAILAARQLDHSSLHLYATYDYWHTSPNFLMMRIGMLLVICFLSYAWCRWGLATWG